MTDPASRPPALGRIRGYARDYVPAAAVVAGACVTWELVAVWGGLKAYILPTPVAVLRSAFSTDLGNLMTATRTTLAEILVGFAAAIVVGVLFSILLTGSKILRRALYPLIIASQTIPTIAIAPVLIIWFGFGILPKVIVVALFGFFPVAVNTVAGMESVETDTYDLMRILGASRIDLYRRVRLPAALPQFFTGAKQAAVYAPIGAVTGEWVGAQNGLGPLMIGANANLNTALVFAAILYLAVVASALYLLVALAERTFAPWYRLTRSPT
jgi:ABC-type nitrate/sulfonate/bicarbonate transport system permease component